ncbi:MAG: molybdenum cofactor guanylyltransferase [Mycobacterium sp.]
MGTATSLAAVVLAGGASRRMGRDKATLPHPDVASMTMVEHVVGVLNSRCAHVFVIAAPGQPLPPLSAEVLRDEIRGVGPLLATGRGLRAAAAAGADSAFVSAVDMPYLTADIIDELKYHANAEVEVVLPWDGRDHYLAGIYRTGLADRVDALVASGRRSMRALAESALTQRVVLPPTKALTNINSQADLDLPPGN